MPASAAPRAVDGRPLGRSRGVAGEERGGGMSGRGGEGREGKEGGGLGRGGATGGGTRESSIQVRE